MFELVAMTESQTSETPDFHTSSSPSRLSRKPEIPFVATSLLRGHAVYWRRGVQRGVYHYFLFYFVTCPMDILIPGTFIWGHPNVLRHSHILSNSYSHVHKVDS
jgi:hypothetical protein